MIESNILKNQTQTKQLEKNLYFKKTCKTSDLNHTRCLNDVNATTHWRVLNKFQQCFCLKSQHENTKTSP
jgi:hypothetical protein